MPEQTETIHVEHAYIAYRVEVDRSNGRVHRRYADERGIFRLTDERCQRDQSGAYDIREAADADPEQLCAFCFPPVPHG